MSIPHDHAPDHCNVCHLAALEEQIVALRAAAESAWVVMGAEPNVPERARARVMAKLQAALRWGVFADEEERG